MLPRGFRATLLLVAATLVALSLGTSAPAHAQTVPPAGPTPGPCGSSYTLTHQFVTVMDGPDNKHAETIDTDLYMPNIAGQQPVVIYANGFGGAKDDASGMAVGQWLASHCYIVLAYSSSGFGNSGGCIELDSPQYDVKDVSGLITWLVSNANPAHAKVLTDSKGPVVGMTGGSYGGAIQLLSAEFDSRIRAITPFRTWNSLDYSLAPQHLGSGARLYNPARPPGVFKYDWATLFFVSGAAGHNGCPNVNVPAGVGPPGICAGFPQSVCDAYTSAIVDGAPSTTTEQLLANSSPLSYLTAGTGPAGTTGHIGLKIPTLLAQGQSDTLFNLNEAVNTYRFLRAHGTPTRLIWHEGGHGYSDQPGEGDLFDADQANPDQKYLPQQILAWFDHWLRGQNVATGPQFSYFQDWVPYSYTGDPAAVPYAAAPDYPAGAGQTFSLSGSNALVPPGQNPPAGATITNPPNFGVDQMPITGLPVPGVSFTECSNFQQQGSTLPGGAPSTCYAIPPMDPPAEFAAFTGAPFTSDVYSVGIPTAHLHLSHTNPLNNGLVLYAKVYDVAPDGSSELIHRLISPFRTAPGGGTVNIFLDGFAHRFAAGHAVRFELAATDSTSVNNRLPDTITVTGGGADPSTFTLPVGAASVVPPSDSPESPLVPALPLMALLAVGAGVWRRRSRRQEAF